MEKRLHQRIKNATKLWTETQSNPLKTYQIINKGEYFQISNKDFEKLYSQEIKDKKIPLCLFLGIENDALMSFMTPSEKNLDSEQLSFLGYNEMLIKQFEDNFPIMDFDPFLKIQSSQGTLEGLLVESFRWNMMNRNWIEQQLMETKDGLFKKFIIPFEDLEKAFDIDGYNEVFVSFGLMNINFCFIKNQRVDGYCIKDLKVKCPLTDKLDDVYCPVVKSRDIATMLLWACHEKLGKVEQIGSFGRIPENGDEDDSFVYNVVKPCPPFCPDDI